MAKKTFLTFLQVEGIQKEFEKNFYANASNNEIKLNMIYNNLRGDVVTCCFNWEDTIEGRQFWHDVWKSYDGYCSRVAQEERFEGPIKETDGGTLKDLLLL